MTDEIELLPSWRVELPARLVAQAHEHVQTTSERYLTFEIPARFLQQAHEHAQASSERHVTLLFVGTQNEMICVGVSTRKPIVVKAAPRAVEPPPKRDEPPLAPLDMPTDWTLDNLTSTVVLNMIRQHGPLGVRGLGNQLGIAGSNISLRQRIRRLLKGLCEDGLIAKTGDSQFPSYVIQAPVATPKKMAKRPLQREIHRADITVDRVLAELRNSDAPLDSRTISDRIGIPRSDAVVRSRVTEHLRMLRANSRIQQVSAHHGGRMYQLTPSIEQVSSE